MNFNYKPIPENLEIKKSDIHGLGLFAKQDFETGFVFGLSHLKISYITEWIRTPIGGFVNHSKLPNCVLVKRINWDKIVLIDLVAMIDIKNGDELTLKYSLEQ